MVNPRVLSIEAVNALVPRLRGQPFTLRVVYVREGEPAIAAALDAVAEGHPTVALGSYPRFDSEADYKVNLKNEIGVEKTVAGLVEIRRDLAELKRQLSSPQP